MINFNNTLSFTANIGPGLQELKMNQTGRNLYTNAVTPLLDSLISIV
ncbi:MAG: hypothetical protein LBK53_01285 [Heliobacteriaceae bacterium]|jgi:hypothetical protein|nr:hypothetical protein [Heliobacteriaceae bacterium]